MASDAPNGNPVPRAVLRIKANTDERVAEFKARQSAQNGTPSPAPEPVAAATPPVEPVSPAPGPTDPPEDPRHSDPKYWKDRFSVADGLMRKNGRDLVQLREQSRQREAELQAQIDELRASAPPAPVDVSRYFTPEQIERFGEDTCRAMAAAAEKAAGEIVSKQVEQHVKPLVQARKDDANRAAEDAKARFDAELDTLLPPNWRDIDTQQPWIDWLTQSDENGMMRNDVLTHHVKRFDAQRAAQMMLTYLKTQRPPAPPAPPVPPVTPSGSGAGGAGNPPAPAVAVGGKLTAADIRSFYKRASLGQVTDKERVEFEARERLTRAA